MNYVGCIWGFCLFLCIGVLPVSAQQESEILGQLKELQKSGEAVKHSFDEVMKKVDDVLWYERVGDVAFIDKVYLCGPPKANKPNPTAMGADNPLK